MAQATGTEGCRVWSNESTSGFERSVFIMFHSTKTAEMAESILTKGFICSKPEGNMLGKGIYASKSLQKATGYGPVTFKLLVYPGMVKTIKKQDDPMVKSWQKDYESAWVPPGCGMVQSGLEVPLTLITSAPHYCNTYECVAFS